MTLTMENALHWEDLKTSARMRELKEREDGIMHRREMKRDSEAHYHSMEENMPDPQAAERFRRKPYKTSVEKIDRSEKGRKI